MKCSNCGSEIPDSSRFCTYCGCRVGANNVEHQAQPPVNYINNNSQAAYPNSPNVYANAQPFYGNTLTKKMKLWDVGSIISCVCMFISIFLSYSAFWGIESSSISQEMRFGFSEVAFIIFFLTAILIPMFTKPTYLGHAVNAVGLICIIRIMFSYIDMWILTVSRDYYLDLFDLFDSYYVGSYFSIRMILTCVFILTMLLAGIVCYFVSVAKTNKAANVSDTLIWVYGAAVILPLIITMIEYIAMNDLGYSFANVCQKIIIPIVSFIFIVVLFVLIFASHNYAARFTCTLAMSMTYIAYFFSIIRVIFTLAFRFFGGNIFYWISSASGIGTIAMVGSTTLCACISIFALALSIKGMKKQFII